MSHEAARAALNRDAAAAGVRPVAPYDARHIFATLLIESGLSDFEVTRLMGHRSIDTTTRIYGHLRPERLSRLQERLGQTVGDSSPPSPRTLDRRTVGRE